MTLETVGDRVRTGRLVKEPMNIRWFSFKMELYSVTLDHSPLEVLNIESSLSASLMDRPSIHQNLQLYRSRSPDVRDQLSVELLGKCL